MKVGDLVVVVNPSPCCGSTDSVGKVAEVLEVVPHRYSFHFDCGFSGEVDAVKLTIGWIHRSRLRVIPPLNELEAEKAVEHA